MGFKFFDFSPQGFLLGLGVAAVTAMIAPELKEKARNMAVKGTQGALVAGGALSNAMNDGKEKLARVVDNDHSDRDMFQQIFNEINAEREELQNLLAEINNIKEQINLTDDNQEQSNQKNRIKHPSPAH